MSQSYLNNEVKYWRYLIQCCHWKGMPDKEIRERLGLGYYTWRRICNGSQPVNNELLFKLARLARLEDELMRKGISEIEDGMTRMMGHEALLNAAWKEAIKYVQRAAKLNGDAIRNQKYPFQRKVKKDMRKIKIPPYSWVRACNRYGLDPVKTINKLSNEATANAVLV